MMIYNIRDSSIYIRIKEQTNSTLDNVIEMLDDYLLSGGQNMHVKIVDLFYIDIYRYI